MRTIALSLLLVACSGSETAPANEPAATPEKAAEAPTEEATPASALQKADAMDGSEDKVIGKCAGCSLGMDGSEENTVTYEDYELQFCSESCKMNWEKDPEKGMERLEAAVD